MTQPTWEQIRAGIFAGESGGDYDAVFGFQNRKGGKFENVRVSQMPVGEVIAFTDPSGEYAQHVKGQIGRVATPVGAYQVVGTTLRAAVEALGIDPNQKFDQATQDRIAKWILANQGTQAWVGYKGPRDPATVTPAPRDRQDPAAPAKDDPMAITRLAYAYANGKMTPEDAKLYEQGMAEGAFPAAIPRGENYQVVQPRMRPPVVPLNAGPVEQVRQPQQQATLDPFALATQISNTGVAFPGLKG